MTCLKLTADMCKVGWAWPSQVMIKLKLFNEKTCVGHHHTHKRIRLRAGDSCTWQLHFSDEAFATEVGLVFVVSYTLRIPYV